MTVAELALMNVRSGIWIDPFGRLIGQRCRVYSASPDEISY